MIEAITLASIIEKEGLEKEEDPSEPELSGDDESEEGEEDATGEEGEKKKRRRKKKAVRSTNENTTGQNDATSNVSQGACDQSD